MTSPRRDTLSFLSFGNSVPTPPGGIEAETLVVSTFEELDQISAQVPGKIVVFDYNFTDYLEAIDYAYNGADEVSKHGGIAALVRSVTDFSIDTPHTTITIYNGNVTKIPTGALTLEDSSMLHRMYERGDLVTLNLTMNAEELADVDSRNAVIEVTGSEIPTETVVVSAHIDSWDVGEGVMDDAGGCVISLVAGTVLMELGLIPRRSLRAVIFTGQEFGVFGGDVHFQNHQHELDTFQLMMESDGGIFEPYGMAFSGLTEAMCMMEEIVNLMGKINATMTTRGSSTPDLAKFKLAGVPTASPWVNSDRYIWFHHSPGDTMEVIDSDLLDACAALYTAVAYVAADMTYRFPTRDLDTTLELGTN